MLARITDFRSCSMNVKLSKLVKILLYQKPSSMLNISFGNQCLCVGHSLKSAAASGHIVIHIVCFAAEDIVIATSRSVVADVY